MATTDQYNKLTRQERQNRYFSEEFKRKKVVELDRNITTLAEIKREYQVSRTAIYKWIYKYSQMRKKQIKQVVEPRSDTRKIQELKKQVRELERMVGQKQIKIEFLEKTIELTEEDLGIKIKKKASKERSGGTGSTGKNTATQ